jgi:hypothetical protein
MSFFIKKNLKWNIYVGTKLKILYLYRCRGPPSRMSTYPLYFVSWWTWPALLRSNACGRRNGTPTQEERHLCRKMASVCTTDQVPLPTDIGGTLKKSFQPTHIGTWLSNVKFQWQIRCKKTYICFKPGTRISSPSGNRNLCVKLYRAIIN